MTDEQVAWLWWDAIGGVRGMNLALIQRPKKVSTTSKQLYIYAPSVLCEGFKLKPESIIKVIGVHEGPTPQETTLKVVEHEAWLQHTRHWYGRTDGLCTFTKEKRGDYEEEGVVRPECDCEKPVEDMPDKLRAATHFVLLSDIGK
jgi:hypothetical protein